MGKKTRAQRNAIRKQGLKEIGQGYKQWLVDGSKKAALGAVKGAFDGAIAGDGVADKFTKGVVSAAKSGIGGAIKDVAQGTWKASKGIFKAIFNDLNWYTNYPELMKGMAGANFCTDNSVEDSFDAVGVKESKAQVAVYNTILTNGSSDKVRHMAIQKIFESTRRANAGAVNSSVPDYNNYYILIRNIVALGSELRRAFGLTNKYTSSNLAVPNLYLQALGLDANDFIANAANIRTYLNQLAQRLEVYVPLQLPIIQRTEWMFRHLFMDSNDVKAQPHAFVVQQYLTYDTTTSAWTVKTLNRYTPMTSSALIQLIEDEIAKLTSVVPAGIIAGDMLKAFGASSLYHFGFVDENYEVECGYSEEVLTQIQNAILINPQVTVAAVDSYGLQYMGIYNNTGVPGSTVSSGMRATYVRDMNEPRLNFYKNDISNAEIVGASRLVVSANATISGSTSSIFYNFGTEVISNAAIYYIHNGSVTYTSVHSYMVTSNIRTDLHALKCWSTIDWMPRVNIEVEYYNSTGGQIFGSVSDIWDYNNSGSLSITSLTTFHEIAYASLYYVPLLSRTNNNLVEVKA